MSKHKLNGFTLLEMIITMIISSIMIVLFYSIIANLYQEWKIFKTRQNEITDMLTFKRTLDRDIDHAIYIVEQGNRQLALASSTDTVIYKFSKQIVRIQKTGADTFDISLSACQTIRLQSMKRVALIKEINMDIAKPIEMKNISFYKHYTSSELMNLYSEQDGY